MFSIIESAAVERGINPVVIKHLFFLITMNLQRLRYFVAVAEELHFGRAAQRLHIAQSAVSQQVRLLESELDVSLFERTTRRVALTDAGRTLHEEAQQLLAAADALERKMVEVQLGEGGTLRLGFVDSAAYEVVPAFLAEYRRRWPQVEYELQSLSSDEQHQALLAGAIDLGVGRTAGNVSVSAVAFLDEPLYVAIGAGHPLEGQRTTSLRRLRDETFVGFSRQISRSLHADLVLLLASAEVAYDPIIEATEYTTILGFVAAGEGIAIVPAGVRTFQPPGLRFVRIRDADARVSLMALTRGGDTLRLVTRAVELLTELHRTTM
jgi:DNA-binding transcriptional LysR family regulator